MIQSATASFRAFSFYSQGFFCQGVDLELGALDLFLSLPFKVGAIGSRILFHVICLEALLLESGFVGLFLPILLFRRHCLILMAHRVCVIFHLGWL